MSPEELDQYWRRRAELETIAAAIISGIASLFAAAALFLAR